MAIYKAEIKGIDLKNLIFVDETGIDKYLYREYGYTLKGTVLIDKIKGKKYSRKSVVAGQRDGKILAPLMYDKTMNSTLFEEWFECCMIPASNEGDVFIMDNASFHRKKQLREICEKDNRRIIFLPPYSPELNPIEKTWAWLKKKLRKIMSQFETLEDAICFVFQTI